MKGWISLHRKVMDHWLFKEKRKFSKFEAWIDILLMVNHEDSKVVLGNELIEVKRGQRIISIRQLCDRWGWSNTKVTQYLNLLQNEGMLLVKSDTKKTLLTVEKYGDYQEFNDKKTTENRHEDDTKQTRKHTNNNDNNANKKTYSSEFDVFWSLYPNKKGKQDAKKKFDIACKKHGFEIIMDGLKKYIAYVDSVDWLQYQHPSTFLNKATYLDDYESSKPRDSYPGLTPEEVRKIGEDKEKNKVDLTPEQIQERLEMVRRRDWMSEGDPF